MRRKKWQGTMQHAAKKDIYQNETSQQSQNHIDAASIRLARAFDRLEQATKNRVQPPPSDELELLREENKKLSTLLQETTGRYEQLRQANRKVMGRLEEAIVKVDALLAEK